MSDFTREELVASLREAADAFALDDALPTPTIRVSIFMSVYGKEARDAFLAARRAFPDAVPTLTEYHVALPVGPGVTIDFSKHTLCTRRTEKRDVEVYDVDPELLLRSEDERQAADDMRADAQADAHAEAQALGYCDDDCRAEIEIDALADELAGAEQ